MNEARIIQLLKELKVPYWIVYKINGVGKSTLRNHWWGYKFPDKYFQLIYLITYIVIKKYLHDLGLTEFNSYYISNADKKKLQQAYQEFVKKELPDLWDEYETFGRPSYRSSKLSASTIQQYLLQLSKSV